MIESLSIEMAFFDGEILLVRCRVECTKEKQLYQVKGIDDYLFDITYSLELPSSPVEIICSNSSGLLYKAALRVGVHTSEDWESIELGDIHTLAFRSYEHAAT